MIQCLSQKTFSHTLACSTEIAVSIRVESLPSHGIAAVQNLRVHGMEDGIFVKFNRKIFTLRDFVSLYFFEEICFLSFPITSLKIFRKIVMSIFVRVVLVFPDTICRY